MSRITTALLICLAIVWMPCSYAAKAVHQFQLKNGLKLIVKEDHRAPIVVSMVWYKVGSAYEHGGITGISHALEHMMFQGTPTYPEGQLNKIIAANGGSQNAMTSQDFTVYFQKLAADRLPISFKLEADRMTHLNLAPKNFEKEIKVVREERLMRVDDNPTSLTYERFMAAAHLVSPYHHPTVGWMDDLLNMKTSDLREWYDDWYVPNNAIIVVVGDVNPNKVHALAKQYFGKIPSKKLPAIKPQREPMSRGERQLTVQAPAKLPVLIMGFNTPSLVTAKDKWKPYALEVLAGILDGGNSARIPRNMIRGEHIASSADVQYDLYSLYDNVFMMYGIPAEHRNIKQLQAAFQQQIKLLQTTLVDQKELNRIKTQVVASKVYAKDSVFGQAMEIGSLEAVGLSWKTGDDYVNKIKSITAEQIRQVAQEYFTQKNLTVAILKPIAINKNKSSVEIGVGAGNVN